MGKDRENGWCLGGKGGSPAVRRFWIVNGFSCLAKPTAIRKFAKRADASYAYLDRFARPLKNPSHVGESNDRHERGSCHLEEKGARAHPVLEDSLERREIGAEMAWREENATGRGVTVAVIDTGILPAPSLVRALAKNPKEKLNGKDDDGNGLIDDVFGYDFTSDTGYVLETGKTMSHGSSCSGIIAGQSSAKGWQTGIAPDSRLLLLKGGFDLRSMEYLLLNGADLVSMSYMIVGRDLGQIRGLFRNAFEHLSLGACLPWAEPETTARNPVGRCPSKKSVRLPKDIPSVLAVAGVDQSAFLSLLAVRDPAFGKG